MLGGSVCGYLVFEWLHLTSHFRMDKGRLGRYITRRHAKHHNIDYHHWFTVSPGGQLVDSALGSDPATLRRRAERPHVRARSPTTRGWSQSRIRFGLDSSLINTQPHRRGCTRNRSR